MGLTLDVRVRLGVTAFGLVLASALVGAQTARAFPPEQVARGEAVFNRACLECHGPDSTDPEAPLLLRADSLRRFPTALAAHKFVSEKMPSNEPGSLPAEEYWDVLAYLLAQNGIGAGDAPLNADTAGAIPTRSGGGRPAPAPKPAGAPETPPAEGEGGPPPAP